jgi:predicted transposase/invertase (TIGR01784 family)
MPKRYLNPKVDLAFKRVFGEHIDLLRSFLNALLPLPEDAPIETLEYLPTEHVPEVPGMQKTSIVDVKCKDTKGRIFIVEMQMVWSASFEQRIVFSGSQAYVKQLYAGKEYHQLQPVYALALTTSIFDRQTDNFYHHYKIVNIENNNRVLPGLEFIFIELSKFTPTTQTDKKMRIKWLRFMNEVTEQGETLSPDYNEDKEIQTALEILETSAYTEAQLNTYHNSIDKMRVEASLYHDAKTEGKAEGHKEGRAEGREEGREEGHAEGREEGIAQIVKALQENGMTTQQISQVSQLSVEEVVLHLAQ